MLARDMLSNAASTGQSPPSIQARHLLSDVTLIGLQKMLGALPMMDLSSFFLRPRRLLSVLTVDTQCHDALAL
jgi:hypothetical protein